MKFAALAISALALTAAMPAQAVIVNVDGVTNASMDGSNAVSVSLAAGTYNLSFVSDAYTAFDRWNSPSGCDGVGASCTTGWENSVKYVIGSTTSGFGDNNGDGGYGPKATGGYFNTAAQSLANAAQYSTQITLASATNVKFYISDDNVADNHGGVSLSVAAVPEPATWAMMILGLGAIGMVARRRSPARANVRIA